MSDRDPAVRNTPPADLPRAGAPEAAPRAVDVAPSVVAEPQPNVQHRLAVGALALLALAAYSNSFGGAFVFDDLHHVRDNLRLRDLGAFVSWDGYLAVRHRYVGYLTFAVNYALGKHQVADYHAVNLAIHVANAVLVYALAVLSFRTPRLRGSTLAPVAQPLAFLAAALFATHPLQTQAVTYIVQRFTSLAALFYVSTVVLFMRWRLARDAGEPASRRAALYAGVLVSAVLAMKTKENAITVPLAVALCEVTFFGPLPFRRRLFLAPILATAAVIPLTFLTYVPLRPAAVGAATRVQTSVSRLDYLLTEASVVLTYLRMLIWPAGQNLDHDVPIAHHLTDPKVLASVAAVTALLGAAVVLYRVTSRDRPRSDAALRLVAFGVVWYFLAISVESSVFPIVDVMYEHRVYLPSVGFFLAAAVVAGLLLRRVERRLASRALVTAAVVLSVALGVATFRRNRVWATELTLWSDAAKKSPNKSRPHANLGGALCSAGRVSEGARELQRAVELEPDSAYARAQLGAAFLALGRLADSELQLREALRVQPRDPDVLFNLGFVLLRTGRGGEATQVLKQFVDVAPPSYAGAKRVARRALEERAGSAGAAP